MIYCIRRTVLCIMLPLLMVLTACQPIQPVATNASPPCTDADKIALLQTYVETYAHKDAAAGVALFLPEGRLSGTGGPALDPATGAYTTFEVEFNGHDEILGILQWFIEGAHLTNRIHDPVVQGDTVTAPGVVGTPYYYAHAIPAQELDLIFTMQVQDCQIADLRWDYTLETLDALPAAAAELARTCSDEYKLGLLQSYASGVNEADPGLAAWPFAEDVHLAFDLLPEWDEGTQSYQSQPAVVIDGLEDFKPVIDYFIEIALTKSLVEESAVITGQTLAISTTISSPSFAGEPWYLPVTDFNAGYIAMVDEQCKIADLRFTLAADLANQLAAMRK